MITPETFYKQTSDNFNRVFKKMDELHKETREDLKENHNRLEEVEKKLGSHLAVGSALEKKESDDKKRNWFITGIVVSLSFGLWKVLEFILT